MGPTPVRGLKIFGVTAVIAEVVDTTIETTTGIPVVVSPVDGVEYLIKRGGRELLQETGEQVAKRADLPDLTYRGDSRSPNEIFERGFEPKGDNRNLLEHATDNPADSNFVSTSSSRDVAVDDFATTYNSTDGQVYTIRTGDGVDVNRTLGNQSSYPNELEIAVPGGVPAENIRGMTPVNADGTPKGATILNPNYRP